MAEKTNVARIVDKVDKQAAIKKTVNKRYTKSQDPKLGPVDWYFDTMGKLFSGLGRFCVALWNVVYIVPALIMGILEGMAVGALAGMKKAVEGYEKRLRK